MSGNFAEHRSKIIFFVVVIAAFVAFFALRTEGPTLRFRDSGTIYMPTYHPEGSYAAFLNYHGNTPRGTARVEVDIFSPSAGENFSVIPDFEGRRVLRTEEYSYVEFMVTVPSAGLYSIFVEYFPIVGEGARGIDIARSLYVNGEIPFAGAELITLHRVWGSDGPIRDDGRGNQIRPPQIELPRWEGLYLTDRLGFFADPYRFFLEAGTNTIKFVGINEPLAISSLALVPFYYLPSHEEFRRDTHLPVNTSDFSVRVQGEDSTFRSSPSLFPLFDNSSGITDPPSVALITLNMVGGTPWRISGQWIEWEVEVPADGLYKLSISARQNHNRGFVSHRTLSVNGEIPFAEVSAIPFHFNNSWELITLQYDDGGDYMLIPLNAGTNTIRMYATLGELGEVIDALLASVQRLNAIYREIIVITGPEPDPLRDYRLQDALPHVMEMIYFETGVLYGLLHQVEALLGERNEHTAVINRIVQQLDLFYARPTRIPTSLVNFRQNVSAFADACRTLTEGPLDIDFFIISGTGADLPVVRETFFTRASHEVRAFVASFTHDFDNIGQIHEGANVLEVWIPTGRDQATAMKTLIDDTFTPQTGLGVNLRLVAQPAVLPAIVAGIGPDVVLSMPVNMAVEYSFRNAVADLSQFPGFHDEIYDRFHPSMWVRLGHGGGYFGIPETQIFNLMFYRHDVLESLGFEAPQTWNDILAMMPILQRNNMAIGIPPVGNPMAPDITGFLTQLYQRGGFLYNEDNSRAILDDENAVNAFDAFTRFFTHFGSPEFFDPATRFRSGEMPVIFVPFTMFNQLSVFAPEIYGLWNFALMPGYDHMQPVYFAGRGDYYRVHHTVPDWGDAAFIVQASELQDEAWQFLKWWTSAETQLRFAREMESIMGEAARFPTANMEAFQSLPWSSSQLAVLNEQRDWILGTPEVPGGYYVSRQLINVLRRVINDNLDTRETLLDVNIVINRELINKRREFGLE